MRLGSFRVPHNECNGLRSVPDDRRKKRKTFSNSNVLYLNTSVKVIIWGVAHFLPRNIPLCNKSTTNIALIKMIINIILCIRIRNEINMYTTRRPLGDTVVHTRAPMINVCARRTFSPNSTHMLPRTAASFFFRMHKSRWSIAFSLGTKNTDIHALFGLNFALDATVSCAWMLGYLVCLHSVSNSSGVKQDSTTRKHT